MYIDNFDNVSTKIYTSEELLTMNPTVKDINYFTDSASLYLSLTVDMFRFCGASDDPVEILNICRTNPNFYKQYTWTKEQRSEFEHKWVRIFMKCLDMSQSEAFRALLTWNAMGTAFDLESYEDEYYKDYLKLIADLDVEESHTHTINISR